MEHRRPVDAVEGVSLRVWVEAVPREPLTRRVDDGLAAFRWCGPPLWSENRLHLARDAFHENLSTIAVG